MLRERVETADCRNDGTEAEGEAEASRCWRVVQSPPRVFLGLSDVGHVFASVHFDSLCLF